MVQVPPLSPVAHHCWHQHVPLLSELLHFQKRRTLPIYFVLLQKFGVVELHPQVNRQGSASTVETVAVREMEGLVASEESAMFGESELSHCPVLEN